MFHVRAECDQRKHPDVEDPITRTSTRCPSAQCKKIPKKFDVKPSNTALKYRENTCKKCSRSLGRCPVPILGTVPLVFTRPSDRWPRAGTLEWSQKFPGKRNETGFVLRRARLCTGINLHAPQLFNRVVFDKLRYWREPHLTFAISSFVVSDRRSSC